MISPKAEAKLAVLFPAQQLDEARQLLPEPSEGQNADGHENVVLAVIKLSEGNLIRLEYFANRTRAFPGVCAVCGELVSNEIEKNPLHDLSRRYRSGATAAELVTAHTDCLEEGERLAAWQGYGWTGRTT
ncbi:MAG TPA: hypothetical protein VNC61_16225 [Acidimicrobiales bacterium]|nr:hypothetical protein [Acidimicrobiales bacterium]